MSLVFGVFEGSHVGTRLVGRNGSGKSNFFAGLFLVLTLSNKR